MYKTILAAAIPQIGEPLGGGFFAGIIKSGDFRFAIVVSPAAGKISGPWNPTGNEVQANSYHDGHANTLAMADGGSPVARAALELQIGDFADWYLPSRDELELLYRHLKPTSYENCESWRDGDNPSSVPAGYPYTGDFPAQTTVAAFQNGAADALAPEWYWSSTQYSRGSAWGQDFRGGSQSLVDESSSARCRAVRRLAIQ